MENKIKAIIKYVENPKFSEDSESSDYLSDGEMLEIVIDELKNAGAEGILIAPIDKIVL